MSWERLIARLERSGLIERGARPPRPEPSAGLVGALLGGISAWLAAAMLLTVVVYSFGDAWAELGGLWLITGLALCGGLALWWRGPARSHAVFLSQLGLVFGLAGYALIVLSPTETINEGLYLRVAGVGLLLWLINPEPAHRRAMVVIVTFGLAAELMFLAGLPTTLTVAAVGASWLWLQVPRWAGQPARRDLETLAWTLSAMVLVLPCFDPHWARWLVSAGGDESGFSIGIVRACSILTALVLAGVVFVQARRSGMRRNLLGLALGGIVVITAATWSMPGVVGGLLIWVLARGAGRNALAGWALAALGLALLSGYYALETSLAYKGLSLLAGGLILLGGRDLLGRLARADGSPGGAGAGFSPGASLAVSMASASASPPVPPSVLPSASPRVLPPVSVPGRLRALRRRYLGPCTPWQIVSVGVGAVLLYGSFNLSILARERLLERGTVVRLALAPVDPRALLLGDYMDLRYSLADQVRTAHADADGPPVDGFAIVSLDARRVARFVRAQAAARPVGPGELALKYRWRERGAVFGTRAYYFQEGHAKAYEAARFGEFRVDSKGTLLLVRLLDAGLEPIRADAVMPDADASEEGPAAEEPAVRAPAVGDPAVVEAPEVRLSGDDD